MRVVRLPPGRRPRTAALKPEITEPAPMVKVMGSPRVREESKTVPSSRQPT